MAFSQVNESHVWKTGPHQVRGLINRAVYHDDFGFKRGFLDLKRFKAFFDRRSAVETRYDYRDAYISLLLGDRTQNKKRNEAWCLTRLD